MPNTPAFQSTGPHGHRSRMRTRLLANPAALADYEILEMLLFLGIPRRDTKPLAKALINQFGDLGTTISARPDRLHDAGLPPTAQVPLTLAAQAAEALAQPEQREQPLLGDLEALDRHLGLSTTRPAGFAAVLLDSRNRLLAEAGWPPDTPPETFIREMLRDALSRHAAAVIVVRDRPETPPRPAQADRALLAAAQEDAAALAITVHDLILTGQGSWTSLRQKHH